MYSNRWRMLFFVVSAVLVQSVAVVGQPATFTPQNPHIGDVVRVTYMPQAKFATLLRPEAITLRALLIPEVGSTPTLLEIPLKKEGVTWTGEYALSSQDARFILYEFISGDLKDDNREQGWEGMVLGPDGSPLRCGQYWRAAVAAFGGHMGFKRTRDASLAKKELAQERKRFPENYSALNLSWYLEMNPMPTEGGSARIRKELVGALKQFRNSEDALPMLLVWFEQVGEQKKADSLRRVIVAQNPTGKVAAAVKMRAISEERDLQKRISLLEKFLEDVPQKGEELSGVKRQLVAAATQAGKFDQAIATIQSMPKGEAALYRSVTAAMLERNADLGKAAEWASKGIEVIRGETEAARPSPMALSDWKRSQTRTLSALLDIRGTALMKLQKPAEAVVPLAEAHELTKGSELTITGHLLEAYIAAGDFKSAMELGTTWIGRWKTNVTMIGQFKTAYRKVHGSLEGYEKVVQAARASAMTELFKEGVNKPAPEVTLKSPAGGDVKLSDYRGRVVVVAFWSTWAPQSKALLAGLQKVVEQYRDYRTVAFLGVSTAESAVGAAGDSLVTKYVRDAKFTFVPLVDEGSQVAQKFSIEGIPAQCVIDKRGHVRFARAGLSDPEGMVSELSAQIEALLKQ